MHVEDGRQQLCIRRIGLHDDPPITDQPVLNFAVLAFVTELGVAGRCLIPSDDLRKRLEHSDEFWPSR